MPDSVVIPIPEDYRKVNPGNGVCDITLIDRRPSGSLIKIQVPKLDAQGQSWAPNEKRLIVGSQGLNADDEKAFDRTDGAQLSTDRDARLFMERMVSPGDTIRDLINYPEGNVQAIKAWLV